MSEQYDLDSRLREQSIAVALISYQPIHLFIRDVGCRGGTVRVSRLIEQRDLLVIEKMRGGFSVRVNGEEVFFFAVTRSVVLWGMLWRLEYWRKEKDAVCVSAGRNPYEDPDDPTLPGIVESVLRSVNHGYLFEVRFKGKVYMKATRKAPPHRGSGGYYRAIIPPPS